MCGRFTQKSERKVISLEFYIHDFISDVLVSYNITPGQDAGVIIGNGQNRYVRYRWGLVPFWAKDPSIGNRMINARAETITEKPSFRQAFASRRCLVPADGFYEWRKQGSFKTPFYIHHRSNRPMSFAGLWENWNPKGEGKAASQTRESEALYTFTIITTEASDKLRGLHDRMPVIIPPEKRELWLDREADAAELEGMLVSFDSPEIDFYEVSRMVNSPMNNTPACIEPVGEEGV
jgi:putative SOS response-associated peptidase YedK